MSSAEKAMKILKKLAQTPYEFGVTEISESIDCVKSGTHKLLSALIAEGMVEQKPNKKYRLGMSVYLLGKTYEENIGIWRFFRPYLEKLRNLTRENASFGEWQDGEATILYKVESLELIRVFGSVGTKRPINASAIGKTLAAHADPRFIRDKIAGEPLKRYTERTITDTEELFREYESIRERGYAISDGEFSEDAVGIGAPVRDKNGHVWAAISTGGPKFRMTPEKQMEYAGLVVEMANLISAELE